MTLVDLGRLRGAWPTMALGICSLAVLFWLASKIDRLDDLETICRSELLKTARMAGTSHLVVHQHYDWWTKTYSGGGFAAPFISHPYETPKVSLVVNFTRDGELRSAWVDCTFAQIPNTGEPPQLAFEKVHPLAEDVWEKVGNQYMWMPPHPRSSANADIGQ